ncbi:MAG: lipoate--protein ligase family protein [Sulfurospirillum sp.]|nr:lipoate--protein ligase family protein [Sulfurospirillum sp.]MBL0703168.1 lipoate--protein ligase family protein [Sulfurospirillum sp.]
MKNWRFIDSPQLSTCANMDLDKLLFDNFNGKPIFRLYSWQKNSFTIGRFQKSKGLEKFGTRFSKRMTGGGLLFHGCDVSYTIIIPIKLLGNKSVKESYMYLCSFLIHFYKNLGLNIKYAKDIMPNSLSKSFFCQEGFEAYDMTCNGKKIGANAQRRTKELILQHGSIPFKKDNRKHTGYSLEEFGLMLEKKEIKKLLKESFIKTFK